MTNEIEQNEDFTIEEMHLAAIEVKKNNPNFNNLSEAEQDLMISGQAAMAKFKVDSTKIIDGPSNVLISKEEIEQNYRDSIEVLDNSTAKFASSNKETTIGVEEKTYTNKELMDKMNALVEEIGSLKAELNDTKASKEITQSKKEEVSNKINFSAVGEFKDSLVEKAKSKIDKFATLAENKVNQLKANVISKKDTFVSKVDTKKEMVSAYAEMVKNNKFVAAVKGTNAVYNEHIKNPVSDKVSIQTLNGLEKVGEVQTKVYNKYKQLENVITLKTESILVREGKNPNDKKEKYKTFYKAAKESGKEAIYNSVKDTKLNKYIQKLASNFREKSNSIKETYHTKSNDVQLKNAVAKEKVQKLSTNI